MNALQVGPHPSIRHLESVSLVAPCPFRPGRIATGDVDLGLRVWQDGQLVAQADLASGDSRIRPTERMRSVAWSRDGRSLVAAAGEYLLALEAETLSERWRFDPPPMLGFVLTAPQAAAILPDGRTVSGLSNGRVAIFDEDGILREMRRDNEAPKFATLAGGRWIGSDGFHLTQYDAASLAKIQQSQPLERIYDLSVDGAGRVAAMRGLYKTIGVDLSSGRVLFEVPTPRGTPKLALASDAAEVALLAEDRVDVWSTGLAGGGTRLSKTLQLAAPPESIAADGAYWIGLLDGSVVETPARPMP